MKEQTAKAIETCEELERDHCKSGIASGEPTYTKNADALRHLIEHVRQTDEMLEELTEFWVGFGRPARCVSKNESTGKWENDRKPLEKYPDALSAYQSVKQENKTDV